MPATGNHRRLIADLMEEGRAFDSSEQVALITGGANGIGAATAVRLAAEGITTIVGDVDDNAGLALAAHLGPPHSYIHLDVTDPAAWATAVEGIVHKLGHLDIVHLNAGVLTRPVGSPMLDDPLNWFTPQAYRRIESINVAGVVFGIQAVLPVMSAHGGQILVTSSTAGLEPQFLDPLYGMTKHALIGLVRSLAPRLAEQSITLMAICPAGIATAMAPADLVLARHKEGYSFRDPSFVADAIVHILQVGQPGDVWLTRADDGGARRHEFPASLSRPGQKSSE